jgi:hypothetical protein
MNTYRQDLIVEGERLLDSMTYGAPRTVAHDRWPFRALLYLLGRVGEPQGETIPEAERPAHIWIDRIEYRISRGQYTGRSLRALPVERVPADYDLYRVCPGGLDELISERDTVEITDGLRFYSVSRFINGG